MTVLVQEALRSGAETLASLEAKYALKAKRHGQYPNLVQLKYDQIASPMADPLVQQCRGIILDEADDWRVVARPFDKFFNLGEPNQAQVDWKTARTLEKLDGSLMIVYFYKGEFHVATSGTPDASGPVGNAGFTFKDLFWKTWNDLGYMFFDAINPNLTYMFELMTPHNRIVVPHDKPRLALIGIRNPTTGEEHSVHQDYLTKRFEVVRWFTEVQGGPETVTDTFKSMSGLDQEGYVVVDHLFRRVKVKHPNYVLYHQMVGSLTKKKVLDAVRKGEAPEVLTYFPTWKAEFDAMSKKLDELVWKYRGAYIQIEKIPVQKDFALAAQKTGLPTAPFFAVRSGKSQSFSHHFAEMRLELLAEIIGLKGDDAPMEQ